MRVCVRSSFCWVFSEGVAVSDQNVLDLLRSSWQVLGKPARASVRRLLNYQIVTTTFVLAAQLVMIALAWAGVALPDEVSVGFLVLVFCLEIYGYVLVLYAHRAVKADYFARAFPGENNPARAHWNGANGFMLALALLALSMAVPNLLSFAITVLLGDVYALSNFSAALWLLLALILVPTCCKRFAQPCR